MTRAPRSASSDDGRGLDHGEAGQRGRAGRARSACRCARCGRCSLCGRCGLCSLCGRCRVCWRAREVRAGAGIVGRGRACVGCRRVRQLRQHCPRVLSERWGLRTRAAGCARELGQQAELTARVAHRDRVAVGDRIRIVQRLLGALIGMRGHPAIGDEDRLPFVQCLVLKAHQQAVAERLATVLRPEIGLAGHAERGQFVSQADRAHEIHEQMRQQVAHLQPAAVAGAQRVIVQGRHHHGRVGRRGQFGLAPGAALRIDLDRQNIVHLVGQQPAQQRGLEHLPEAVPIAGAQRRQHARQQRLRGGVGGHLQGRIDRTGPRGQAAELQHAAHFGRDQRLVRRIVGIRAAAPEGADPADDQARIGRHQFGIGRRAGRQQRPADPDIAAACQRQHCLALGRNIGAQHHASLAAQPQRRGCDRAPGIASGRFDLGHLRAVVG